MSEQHEEPPEPHLPGYRVGRYLGGGASGMVWAVTRLSDDARLAAKVLLAPLEEALTEVAYLQRLEHEHVLRLHDSVLETTGPQTRLAMITDLAEGGSLGSSIAGRGHLTVGELVTVLTPLARTLHDLHGQGLVHGDLSPANVLMDVDGKPLLADFGVARLAADGDAQVWGTDGFVAPEVLAGAAPTPASDVYALGALGWTALVGEEPPPAALRPHLPDVAPQAPSAVCDLILSCLAHTPDSRPDAGALALAMWDSAAAEPAPRAGSEGARHARAVDPWAGLTQRIRETARTPDPEPERVWHRLPAVRRTLVAAGLVGVLGSLVVVWPESEPMQVQAELVAAAGTPHATPTTKSTARRDAPHSSAGPSTRTAVAARSQRATSPRRDAGSARPASSKTAASSRRESPSPAGKRLARDPGAVVQRLVDARARAWTRDGARLANAMQVDSAAWRRDKADLKRAAEVGATYRGLRFTVRRAEARSVTARRAVVEVTVDRSRYRVHGAHPTTAPASRGQRVVLTLTRTGGDWRIADWSSR